jgi:hypothetical protein
MRLLPLFAAGVLGFVAATAQGSTSPPSPLRFIPAEADIVLQVREPTRVANLVRNLELIPRLIEFPAIKEQLDSTAARRLRQLLAYAEKTLGARWPDLLDKLAGGGVAVGARFGNNAPAVLVVQGKDEKTTEAFFKLGAELIEAELARQESKDKLEKGDYHGIPGYKVGNGLFLARAGAALVFSNRKEAMTRALDLHLGKHRNSMANHPHLAEADKLLPKAPLAQAWINMKPAQQGPEAKALYKTPRDNFQLTVLFGGYMDIFGRTPFLCAALSQDAGGYRLMVSAPRGTDGMDPGDRALHVPPKGDTGGRPLLEPPGVLYSASFYFDFARIWTDRDKLFPKVQADGLAQFDKSGPPAQFRFRLSRLLESTGAHHRVVVANQTRPGYKKRSQVTIPAFAFIPELRNPDRFARNMDAGLRAAALAFTNVIKMDLAEETHKGIEIVGYRFPEKEEVKDDVNDIRFAFSPCWARVGDHFLFCSTIELCRDLIDQLKSEQKPAGKVSPYKSHDRYYAAGFAELLNGIEDQLVTQAILDQAIAPAEAKKQVKQFIGLLRGLGGVRSYSLFDDKVWRFEFRFGK